MEKWKPHLLISSNPVQWIKHDALWNSCIDKITKMTRKREKSISLTRLVRKNGKTLNTLPDDGVILLDEEQLIISDGHWRRDSNTINYNTQLISLEQMAHYLRVDRNSIWDWRCWYGIRDQINRVSIGRRMVERVICICILITLRIKIETIDLFVALYHNE